MSSLRFDRVGIVSATDAENLEAIAFFRDVLQLPVSGEAGYAEVALGEQVIALHRGGMVDLGRHGGTLLQCQCDEVRRTVEAVRVRGGRILVEPWDADWGTTSTYVAGPNGIVVELSQPAPPDPEPSSA